MKAIFKGGPYDSETTEIEAGVTRRQHWWNLTVDEIEKGTTRGPDYEYVYTGQFDDEGRAIYEFHDNRQPMKTYVEKEVTYIAACHHCDWYFISNDTKLIETERQQHESIDHQGDNVIL